MKKLFLMSILPFFLFNFSFSQKIKYDIESFKVKGNVKELKAFTYNV